MRTHEYGFPWFSEARTNQIKSNSKRAFQPSLTKTQRRMRRLNQCISNSQHSCSSRPSDLVNKMNVCICWWQLSLASHTTHQRWLWRTWRTRLTTETPACCSDLSAPRCVWQQPWYESSELIRWLPSKVLLQERPAYSMGAVRPLLEIGIITPATNLYGRLTVHETKSYQKWNLGYR